MGALEFFSAFGDIISGIAGIISALIIIFIKDSCSCVGSDPSQLNKKKFIIIDASILAPFF
jgi:hypothetical protein